ncbi:hypothetical protein GCM10018793_13510 [Streptomyces sulfonofaciens]|uniref:DUF3887 domain-containing protein n=1 Tax=Streptomyces sulfonofaciens TaxID=68272 RepID=A0A919FXZ0_9ACTN|nr:hypothetical protein [Streptomyces sulfonofaciens]GHH73861.1 hypothetical protein GCM10018793_13510 [Streptomyces sulfonofaciens]
MFSNRIIRRAALTVAVTAAVLPLAAAGPALAAGSSAHHAPAGVAAAHSTTLGAVQRVDTFYNAYIDAVRVDDFATADKLRAEYLSSAAQADVESWEEANHANGILHAQDVPDGATAVYEETAAGTVYLHVDLKWGSDTSTVLVRYSNVDQVITGISDPS